jgi:K+-sensing histidine kinase KdpD
MDSVLACLPPDEERARAVIGEAARLAAELKAPLSIVHLYPAAWNGPLRAHPTAWHLMTDEPAEAVRRFAERRRITRVVFAR